MSASDFVPEDLPPARRTRVRKPLLVVGLLLVLVAAAFRYADQGWLLKHRVGATTEVTEVSTGVVLPARVDTGAQVCSMHYDAVKVDDAADESDGHIGKPISFLVRDQQGQDHWINTTIAEHGHVRTPDNVERRYVVYLTLRAHGVEKKVLVSLNNRERMNYPVLIGRNFLRQDFLVDVDEDSDDWEWGR